VMVRKINGGVIKAVIVETEAYKAPLDRACHAFNSNTSIS
jgi:3-methyladenine DNA glycosylase Mpg